MGGRVPKRKSELVDQRPSRVENVSHGVLLGAEVPRAKAGWHPVAKRIWDAFGESGQVEFWQQSDWALAYSITDDLSRFKRAEDQYERALAEAIDWDKRAGDLSSDERREQGFSVKRPYVPRYGSANKMAEIYRVLGTLLVTEADRRKVGIELSKAAVEDSDDPVVVAIADYRRELGMSG